MNYFNNPLNIRSGSKWIGIRGNKNGFCEFNSIVCCIRAGLYLLLKSYPKHGVRTISDCISRWAPPSENLTTTYINYVLCFASLKPNNLVTNLSVDKLFLVIKAMCRMETNYNLSRNEFDIAYNLLFHL